MITWFAIVPPSWALVVFTSGNSPVTVTNCDCSLRVQCNIDANFHTDANLNVLAFHSAEALGFDAHCVRARNQGGSGVRARIIGNQSSRDASFSTSRTVTAGTRDHTTGLVSNSAVNPAKVNLRVGKDQSLQ